VPNFKGSDMKSKILKVVRVSIVKFAIIVLSEIVKLLRGQQYLNRKIV
jgi:hypothetical protein